MLINSIVYIYKGRGCSLWLQIPSFYTAVDYDDKIDPLQWALQKKVLLSWMGDKGEFLFSGHVDKK